MPTPDELNLSEGTAPGEELPSVQKEHDENEREDDPHGHENEDHGVGDGGGKKHRKRPRKQHLYSTIRTQMEFYFSDVNISKQGMMRKLIESAEYVNLSIFVEKFNKISSITKNVDDVRRALKYSEKLVLSEDGTGVKRAVPYDEAKLKSPQEIEECTIYVENIPMTISTPTEGPHDWIQKIFQEFGSVAYVSLPKFKKSGQHKGFAFVEFEDRAGAQRCLEAFGELGACLPTNIDPSGLLSITAFNEEHQEQPVNLKSILCNRKKQIKTEAVTEDKVKIEKGSVSAPNRKIKFEDSEEESIPLKKVKLETEPDDVSTASIKIKCEDNATESKKHELSPTNSDSFSPTKKIKIEKTDSPESITKPEKRIRFQEPNPEDESQQPLKKPKIEEESASASESGTDAAGTACEKKKKKKKRRKNKNQEFHVEKLESDLITLRILPKKNWRQLRNRYLNLQRENMSKLKAHLRARENRRYLEQPKDIPQIITTPAGNYKSICVKIGLESPAKSVEEFKTQITTEVAPEDWYNFVKYVDYNEGDLEATIRLDGGPAAGEGVHLFVANASKVYKAVHLMTEQETDAYWKSLKTDLKEKKKQKKVRGKDKLLNQATKFATSHIHFEDQEEPITIKEEKVNDDSSNQ